MDTIQDRYINPLTDFGFKKLFGSEPNKSFLIDFLNQILPERHQIEDLTYSRNEQVAQHIVDRKAIFDLFCQGKSGERFIVELQKAKQDFFKDRSVFYASFPIREQARRGEWNFELQPVYTIGILDFTFTDQRESPEPLHFVELKDQHCEVFYDKLKFVYIELPKFRKSQTELRTQLDKWLYVFRYLSQLQDRPEALQERIFERLFEAAEIARFSKRERAAYETSLKYYWDLNNVVESAERKGILQVARAMLQAGEPLEKVQAYTNLSSQELAKLDK